MRFLASRLPVVLLVFSLVSGSPVFAQDSSPAEGEASIEQPTLPAAGRHATTFRVPSFGRWSVALSSERGVALQLVDRVNGPGEVFGSAGEADGRVDVFLERGEYQVVSRGVETGAQEIQRDLGEAKLTVRPFREIEERAVTLPDLAEVETQLGDLEQVSWWILLQSKQRVAFEAAGRHLEDFRLWRDGTWIVGEEPSFEDVEPFVGRPLRIARLATELPPGLYRLTAYGGAGLPWAEDDGSRPLYLRTDVPTRGEAGRSRMEVSEFGIDRFVVPASASFFRLEVPGGDLRSDAVLFEVDDWDETDPYDSGNAGVETIHKELRELVVEHQRSVNEKGRRVITIRAAAGQPYVLQHFRRERVYRFKKEGEYWIDTIHSGHPADAVEATAMLFDLRQISRYVRPVRAEVVQLHSDTNLRRKFNLHEPATLFLEAVERGSYRLRLDGVEAEVRLEPYLLPGQTLEERPPERRLRPGESTDWDLDPGYYVLTLEPEEQGVADLTLAAASLDGAGSDPGPAPTARLGRIYLDETSYLLHQNEQPGIRAGVVLRPLPLNLSEPLPFVLSGVANRSTVTVPVEVPGDGTLRAAAEDGTELELRLEGAAEASSELAVSGGGKVTVSAVGDLEQPVAASLFWEPLYSKQESRREPLPELPAGTLEALPELPVLTSDHDQFLELSRRDRATYLVRADEAALYRLESTGLLDTTGVLRTRVVPELERAEGEGSGRNFRIQRYLGAGEYQLTVNSRGLSQGTLGLRLASTPIRPAGRLEPGIPARGWIDPDASLEYRFDVDEPGRWRIRVLGLGGLFPVRIEDADGWPLTRPARPGDQTVELDAGEHRLVVLPQAVRARHVALVERIPDSPSRDGHGPFPLAMDETVEHRWEESTESFRSLVDGDGELPADRWRLELSAPVELRFSLSRGAVADVVRLRDGHVLGRVTSLRGLDEAVPAGVYEIQVRPARRNNRVDYTLRVEPLKLLPGYGRTYEVPGTIPLSVGTSSLVEIASFGTVDVRARLLDAGGRQLAQSDDRPGDWNLRLVRRLEPGQYQIELGGSGGEVRLDAAVLDEVGGAPLYLGDGPASRSLTPGRSVHVAPLDPGLDESDRAGVLMARAESAEGLRLTLESRTSDLNDGDRGDGWRAVAFGEGPIARLAYVPSNDEALRLRLEALDRGSSEVTLSAAWAGTQTVDEARLARGVRVRDELGGRGIVAVSLERPGCFDFTSRPKDMVVIGTERVDRRGRALRAAPDLAGGGDLLWLEAPSGSEVRAERWLWTEGEPRRLRLMPGERATCDLAPSDSVRLLSARGLGDQATLAIAGGAAQAADGSEALALALPLAGTATIGLGSNDAGIIDGLAQPAEVQLVVRSFDEAPPQGTAGSNGRLHGTVAAGTSQLYSLPPGPHRLRVTLGPGVAAAITTGRNIDLLHRASRDGVEVVRDVRPAGEGSSYLRILAPEGGDGLFEVSLLPQVERDAPKADVLVERGVQRHGVLDVDVPAGESRLQVRGAERATLLGGDGAIRTARGPEASLQVPTAGGRLVVEHQPGYVMAWLGDGVAGLDSGLKGRSSTLPVPSVRQLTAPGESFLIQLEEPKVLHLRTPASALVSLRTDGVGQTELAFDTLSLDMLSLDAWLPEGESRLTIQSLAGRGFGGDLEATASEVMEIGEGLGPELLLPPGATRYASFEVERAGKIGVAVRADSEVVSARLLDARGRELPGSEQGVLLMRDLEPGRYLLAFTLPADHPPVRVRPVVVGLEPPSGPPEDVVQRYLEFAEESP